MQVQESNIVRLYWTANALAQEQFPDLCGVFIRSCARTDKKTDKDYGFHDKPHDLRCELSPEQQLALKQMKEGIYARLIGDSTLKNGIDLLLGWESQVNST